MEKLQELAKLSSFRDKTEPFCERLISRVASEP